MNNVVQFAFVLFALFITGCEEERPITPVDNSNVSTNGSDEGNTKVSLLLNWTPEAEHGGFYAALLNGHYAAEGIEVKIVPGGKNAPVIQRIATGQDTFGVCNADQILTGRNQEADVVALLAPIQDSPRCIMVHKSSGITSLDQLNDMTLAMSSGRSFAVYMQKHLPLENVEIVPYQPISIFLEDKNFGQQGYVFSEPFVAQQNGAEPHVLMVSDLGFNPYTSILFTTGDRINSDPELVEKMTSASKKGWQDYLDDPTKTNEYIHSINEQMSVEALAFGAAAIKPLSLTEGMSSEQIGMMTTQRWQTLLDQLAEIDHADASLDINDAFISGAVE
ncbi:MAG: ABC transporter substrate-binding protein [Pirellulales bacterium]|nr:ABC transporter substrate-binding protein [Pirellulales bacterium]